jgi:hypothetical protein
MVGIPVAIRFRDVNGMWLQTDLVSTANVRLLGQYTMVSRDMAYKMVGLEASGATISAGPLATAGGKFLPAAPGVPDRAELRSPEMDIKRRAAIRGIGRLSLGRPMRK